MCCNMSIYIHQLQLSLQHFKIIFQVCIIQTIYSLFPFLLQAALLTTHQQFLEDVPLQFILLHVSGPVKGLFKFFAEGNLNQESNDLWKELDYWFLLLDDYSQLCQLPSVMQIVSKILYHRPQIHIHRRVVMNILFCICFHYFWGSKALKNSDRAPGRV